MLNFAGTDSVLTLSGYWAAYTDLDFNVKHCRICISYYFFAMAAALILLCRDQLFFYGIAAAAMHESGHMLAIAASHGSSISRIDIGALGIRITAQGNSERPFIILAGVLANLIFSLAALPFLACDSCHIFAISFIAANLCLAFCNILPIEPLDGGTLLRCIAEKRLAPETADRTVFIISLCVIIPLAAAGLFAAMQSRGNFSLLILCLWLLAGILRRYI